MASDFAMVSGCRIIFTGGGAPHYLPHLSSEVLHLPDLVLQGLLLVSGGK